MIASITRYIASRSIRDDHLPSFHQARVASGARLLDQKVPGWNDRIDRIDMICPRRCVLGQLFGWHTIGLTKLCVNPHVYGFACEPSARRIVTRAWNREIRKRRADG